MTLPRGIFAKLVGVFLLVGLLPFLGMAAWTYSKARTGMTEAVVESWLVRLARETAANIDRTLSGLRTAVLLWSEEDLLGRRAERAAGPQADTRPLVERLTAQLGRRAARLTDVALAMVIARDGRILAAATSDRGMPATPLLGRNVASVAPDARDRAWIARALASDEPLQQTGWHRSPFVEAIAPPGAAQAWQIGYAAPLRDDRGATVAAIAVLFHYQAVQQVLDETQIRFADDGRGSERGARYPSGYAFLFDADADTVIGHKQRELYGTSLVRDHDLAGLHQKIKSAPFGFDHYEYPRGTGKISGFARTLAVENGGFGWIVGVGINHADVYADVVALRDMLAVAALIVAGFVVLMAALLSARITRPLTRLVGFTESVARGNLDARVSIKTRDEIAVLAEAFNRMTADLKETNTRLIQAEKDAAWREMARQVAHEIKNPLTPIMLSAQQIERAATDERPDLKDIIKESVTSIVEQCTSLKDIAQNFASYAAFPKPRLQRVELEDFVEKVVSVFAAHQRDGLRVQATLDAGGRYVVRADIDAMRRVFLNLFNNAYEAMGGKGTIMVKATVEGSHPGARARIAVIDTGRGIGADDLKRLFEPYFSTRTGGTGLGLAICRKIVTEHDGSITVTSEAGKGTTFTITLPCYPAGAPMPADDDAPFSDTRTLPRGR